MWLVATSLFAPGAEPALLAWGSRMPTGSLLLKTVVCPLFALIIVLWGNRRRVKIV